MSPPLSGTNIINFHVFKYIFCQYYFNMLHAEYNNKFVEANWSNLYLSLFLTGQFIDSESDNIVVRHAEY